MKRIHWIMTCSIAGAVLATAGTIALFQSHQQHAQPKGLRFTIGPDTTVIDGPILPDGTIDYIGTIDRRRGEGVTPENNIAAGVLAIAGYDDRYFPNPARRQNLYEQLGVPLPTSDVSTYETWDAYCRRKYPSWDDNTRRSLIKTSPYDDPNRPWKRTEAPDYAAYLESLEPLFVQLDAAFNRPKFFIPQGDGHGRKSRLPLLPSSQISYYFLLSERARLRAGEGDWAAFWTDVRRLNQYASSGDPGLFSTIDRRMHLGAVSDILHAAANSGRLPMDLLRLWLRELDTLPEPQLGDDAWNVDLRFNELNLIMSLLRKDEWCASLLTGIIGVDAPMPAFDEPDYDLLLRTINDVVDRGLQASKQSPDARRAFVQQINASFEAAHFQRPLDLILDPKADPDKLPSAKANAETFLKQRPDESKREFTLRFSLYFQADIRDHVLLSLLLDERRAKKRAFLAAMAAYLYHADHGAWPNTLADLQPAYLTGSIEDPLDPGHPLRCLQVDGKFRIYSIGRNGVDDGGIRDSKTGKDDVAIDMPLTVTTAPAK